MKHVLVLCCSAGARSNVMVVNLWLVSLTLSSSMLRFTRKSHLISFKCLQTKSYCNSGTYKLRMHDEQLYNLFKSPLQNVNIVKKKKRNKSLGSEQDVLLQDRRGYYFMILYFIGANIL